MNIPDNKVFQKFHYTFLRRNVIKGCFTFVDFLQAQGFKNEKLLDLAKSLNDDVYRNYISYLDRGYNKNIFEFIMDKYMNTLDALCTSEYKAADTLDKRKKTYFKWLSDIHKLIESSRCEKDGNESNDNSSVNQDSYKEKDLIEFNDIENSQSNVSRDICVLKDDLYDFYVNFKDSKNKDGSNRSITTQNYGKKNIVVQPGSGIKNGIKDCCCNNDCTCDKSDKKKNLKLKSPVATKNNNNKKNPIDNVETQTVIVSSVLRDSIKCSSPKLTNNNKKNDNLKDVTEVLSPVIRHPGFNTMNKYTEDIRKGDMKSVPRNHLEKLAKHLSDRIDKGDESYHDVYKNTLDIIHNDFDLGDTENIRKAFNDVAHMNLRDVPRRERREVLHMLLRGPSRLIKIHFGIDIDVYKKVLIKMNDLHKLVDEDIKNLGQRLSDIIEKYNDGNNTYILGHNELPIIRSLLNENDESKISKYLEMRKTVAMDQGLYVLGNTSGGNKLTWDSSLSFSLPFISSSGKSKIYASTPFKDHVTFFKKWLLELGITKEAVFMAPTDDIIISNGIEKKLKEASLEEKRKFVEKYRVESFSSTLDKIKEIMNRKREWDFEFKFGDRVVDLAIKTNILYNGKTELALIPIYFV